MVPKVLVGCPTSDYKSYCIEKYAESVKRLSYKNYDILIVDNSEKDGYFKRIKKLNLPVIRSKYFEGARDRIIESRNILRKKILTGKTTRCGRQWALWTVKKGIFPEIMTDIFMEVKAGNEKGPG